MFAKLYYYQNFNIPSGFDSLDILVWGVYIGIMAGAVYSTVDKLFCTRFLKTLVRQGARTPETALALTTLDIGGKWYLKGALKEGKPLRKMLSIPETAADIKKSHEIPFYLPEENQFRAENRFNPGHRPIMTLIIAAAVSLAAVFFVLFAVPELLTMLDNLVGFIKYGE